MLLTCMVMPVGRAVCCLFLHAIAASEQKRHCINLPLAQTSVRIYTMLHRDRTVL